MYPQLKTFEKVCDRANIKFPVDHIQAGGWALREG